MWGSDPPAQMRDELWAVPRVIPQVHARPARINTHDNYTCPLVYATAERGALEKGQLSVTPAPRFIHEHTTLGAPQRPPYVSFASLDGGSAAWDTVVLQTRLVLG